MDLKEIACEGVDWIHPAQDMSQWHALVNMVMNLSVPLKVENFLTSFYRRTLLHGLLKSAVLLLHSSHL
jgi:hypothetical protein